MPTLNRTYFRPSHLPKEEPRKVWGKGGKADVKFYKSKSWIGIRASILQSEPLCRECRKAGKLTDAKYIDHIKPRHDGGGEDLENLQPLCASCHNRKSAKERRR